MRQDRAGDPAQAADLVAGLVGGDRRQDDMVHSCPQQRFQASLAILVGSRNGKRIDHLVTYPADNLRPVPGRHYIMKDGRFHAEPGDHDALPPDQHELLSTSTDAGQQRP